MQLSENVRFNTSSRTQYPLQASMQPIILSASRAPQYPPQYPPQYSSQYPLQFSTLKLPQTIYHQSAQNPSRVIEAAPSLRQPPYPVIYPQQPIYSAEPQYLHPHYLVQPVPIVRRHPQYDLNPNFDYESANLLCEAKIVESTIFCVVCGTEYKMSEKEQHILKHARKAHEKKLNQQVMNRVQEYRKKQTKPSYIVKPIVEPEQVDVHFDPNVYQVIQEIIYEDEESKIKKQAAIGQDANSFSVFDNNVSIAHNNAININLPLDSQPNPFFSKYEKAEDPLYHIPDFEIPAPVIVDNYQPQIQEELHSQDEPVIYNEDNIPLPSSHKSIPVANISHLVEESFPEKTQHRQIPGKLRSAPIIPEDIDNPAIAHQENIPAIQQSGRFEPEQPFQFFPPEVIARQVYNQHQDYSGPHEFRAPSVSRSKQSTEVNISQFIRDLNTQNDPFLVQDRNRIPHQSEW